MATYDFSTLISAGAKSMPFFSFDILTFNDSISAADLLISNTSSGGIIIKLSGGNELTLTSFIQIQISSQNFIFANGSKLLIGDASTATANDDFANIVEATEFNDYFDGRSGSDTITYKTATSAVTVNLVSNTTDGGAGNDKLISIENITGSNFNDVLTGLATAGSAIDGGAGIDTMTGGTGNDTYTVTSGDIIIDGGGTDTVISSIDYSLANGLENLTLLIGATNGYGNNSANILIGNSGNNFLDGSGGADNMQGGSLNDTYVVDNVGDIVTEATGAGTDLVLSNISITSLALNVENLQLTGTGTISGTGNTLDNIIYANKGNNVLDGGANTTVGDTVSYLFGATKGVTISLGTTAQQTTIGSGLDTLLNFENLTGSSYADTLTGSASDNVISGGLGNDALNGGASIIKDTLVGGKGNDTYTVDTNTDVIIEIAGEGIDTIVSSVDYTIQTLTNIENITITGTGTITATGNALNNVLRGQSTGLDKLIGGAGNDSYYIGSVNDQITELAGQGTDTVFAGFDYTIADVDVENITMIVGGKFGTGTSGVNILTASSLGNTLNGLGGNDQLFGGDGADSLDGGTGNDSMTGRKGNDTYVVDSLTDSAIESLNEGTDLVRTNVNNYILAANIENLTLTDTTNLKGTGNTLANYITGNSGNNILDGSVGNDTLEGLAGNDTYVVDSNADVVKEAAGSDIDLVQSTAANYTLATNVENLTLIGTNAINGDGNSVANLLTGNTAKNTLSGGAGNDTLDGSTGVDTLAGNAGDDTFYVENSADIVKEIANEGTDLVISSTTYVLNDADSVGVENLNLTGNLLINGTGNSLKNIIVGNGSANMLDGNAGQDTLTGGTGKDVFIFSGVNEITTSTATTDRITDFNKATDKDVIDLSILFNGVAPSLLALRGTNFTDNGLAQLRYATSGSDTVISGDLDGDTTTDFTIVLTGNLTTTFAVSDFDFTL